MTESTKDQGRKAAANSGNGGAVPKVHWDQSKMKSTYSNVCNVASTREEVTLLFGTNQTWHSGQKELTVELSDRIILNPYAAKRLSMLLNTVVQQYEARFGELKIEGEKHGSGK